MLKNTTGEFVAAGFGLDEVGEKDGKFVRHIHDGLQGSVAAAVFIAADFAACAADLYATDFEAAFGDRRILASDLYKSSEATTSTKTHVKIVNAEFEQIAGQNHNVFWESDSEIRVRIFGVIFWHGRFSTDLQRICCGGL